MRNLLLGAVLGALFTTSAGGASRERIPLDRMQDRPPERIDLMAAAEPAQEMAAGHASAGPDLSRRSVIPYLRSVAMLVVPAALARTASPLTRRTDDQIRKGEKSGQLSKQEARRLRQANDAAAYSAWNARASSHVTDAEASFVRGQAEAISSYVFERRSAAKTAQAGAGREK